MLRSVLVASLVLVGCRGGEKPVAEQPASTGSSATSEPRTPATTEPAPTPPAAANDANDVALERMQTFADAMCACTDAACAKRVTDEQTAWASQFLTENPNPPTKSAAQVTRMKAVATQMVTCSKRIP